MLFSSITFLFLFLPIMLAVYYIAPPQWKNLLLLAGSLIFYAWGEPVYIILMILSILLNYFCGMDIENKSENEAKAKRSLVFAITVNIVLLVFFKYFGFLVESTNTLFGISIPYRELALPIGLSKKAVLANTLGKIFEEISSTSASNLTVLMAWLGCITYAFQIYFDFSGYSDMAIGLGRMFGFEFKKNFDVPYISKSITEFWRRWHISLSSWFREYVYIPLGGNHVTISRNIVNLLIVWMLTGMWHGAAWNFIVWGIYYGVVLVLEKYVWGAIVDRWPSVLQHIYALVLVLVGWVFFFSPSLGAALRYLFAMVGGGAGFAGKEVFFVILTHWLFYLLAVIGSTTLGSRMLRAILNVSENHTVRIVITLVVFFGMLAISVAYLIADTYNPFLYFRF